MPQAHESQQETSQEEGSRLVAPKQWHLIRALHSRQSRFASICLMPRSTLTDASTLYVCSALQQVDQLQQALEASQNGSSHLAAEMQRLEDALAAVQEQLRTARNEAASERASSTCRLKALQEARHSQFVAAI